MDRTHRSTLASIAGVLVAHKDSVNYLEARPVPWLGLAWPIPMHQLEDGETFTSDCSGTIIAMNAWAGNQDPSGNSYSGAGNTDSFLAHLTRTARPERGAIGVFGAPGRSVHAVMLTDLRYAGPSSQVFSHGQQSGPFLLPLGEEIAAHPGQQFTWLSVASL